MNNTCLSIKARVWLCRNDRRCLNASRALNSSKTKIILSNSVYPVPGTPLALSRSMKLLLLNDVLNQGFTTLALLMFGTRWCIVARGCPVHCRMLSSIHSLYLLETSSVLPLCTPQSFLFLWILTHEYDLTERGRERSIACLPYSLPDPELNLQPFGALYVCMYKPPCHAPPPILTIKNVSRHCQISLVRGKVPIWQLLFFSLINLCSCILFT